MASPERSFLHPLTMSEPQENPRRSSVDYTETPLLTSDPTPGAETSDPQPPEEVFQQFFKRHYGKLERMFMSQFSAKLMAKALLPDQIRPGRSSPFKRLPLPTRSPLWTTRLNHSKSAHRPISSYLSASSYPTLSSSSSYTCSANTWTSSLGAQKTWSCYDLKGIINFTK